MALLTLWALSAYIPAKHDTLVIEPASVLPGEPSSSSCAIESHTHMPTVTLHIHSLMAPISQPKHFQQNNVLSWPVALLSLCLLCLSRPPDVQARVLEFLSGHPLSHFPHPAITKCLSARSAFRTSQVASLLPTTQIPCSAEVLLNPILPLEC